MQTKIRKIGNSKGIIIPNAFLSEAGIEENIEISLKGKTVVITPTKQDSLRKGWFDNTSQLEKEPSPWEGFVALPSEQEDWEW